VLLPEKGKTMSGSIPRDRNRLLARLSPGDYARLEPNLAPVALNVRDPLEAAGRTIKDAYFVLDGIVSLVAGGGLRAIEIGIIGREGMTGTVLLLGATKAAHRAFVQVAGEAVRIKSDELIAAMAESPTLRPSLLHYVRAILQLTAQTAFANGLATTEQRLARWLLMCQDRLDRPDIALTHEFLSLMLGVWRPMVTLALQSLTEKELVTNGRGVVAIVNRKGLEKLVGDIYKA
jgi:CRP-like cAMP-binding protein